MSSPLCRCRSSDALQRCDADLQGNSFSPLTLQFAQSTFDAGLPISMFSDSREGRASAGEAQLDVVHAFLDNVFREGIAGELVPLLNVVTSLVGPLCSD